MPLRPPAGFISANYDPLRNPDAPTGVEASAGDAQASVSFTAPVNVGGSAISAYYAVSNPGQITASGASSPVTVTGLSNGTAYTFQVWALNTFGPGAFSAASGSVTPAAAIALFMSGSSSNVVDYVNIATTGNAVDWGDYNAGEFNSGGGSSTRALAANSSGIVYFTYSSQGNSTTFGNLTVSRNFTGCVSNSTQCVWAGGNLTTTLYNVLDYVTTATTGNAVDFGDLSGGNNLRNGLAGAGSSTTGLFMGGQNAGTEYSDVNYITIATTGNAAIFGNLNAATAFMAAASSSTRAVHAGGINSSNVVVSTMDYTTISTSGSFTNFGNLTLARQQFAGTSNKTRAVFGGGEDSSSVTVNVIDYITIASTGNATDFGDLTVARRRLGCAGNAHGGLA